MSASAGDATNVSGSGCSRRDCQPSVTHDGGSRYHRPYYHGSYWAYGGDVALEAGHKITYDFEEAQDIAEIRIAFGVEHPRPFRQHHLRISANGREETTIASSGRRNEFDVFLLDTEKIRKINLDAVSLNDDELVSSAKVWARHYVLVVASGG